MKESIKTYAVELTVNQLCAITTVLRTLSWDDVVETNGSIFTVGCYFEALRRLEDTRNVALDEPM